MYTADLKHPDQTLEQKLYTLYNLGRDKKVDLSFRPPYLELLEAFGNPHLHLPPVIHVAGTNGKGSVVAMLRAMLEAAGHQVHAYTSPHLQRFNERIYLAGSHISDEALEALIDEAIELNQGHDVTFFEVTTAIAFAAFLKTPADFTLLEVGLGGRLDCTNVIQEPLACIITMIAHDHSDFLGDTLVEIAAEKAGIMKKGVPCIIGPQTKEAIDAGVIQIFEERADALNAPLYRHGSEWIIEPHETQMRFCFEADDIFLPQPNLTGAHQINNAGTALAAIYTTQKKHNVSQKNAAKGLRVIDWPARLEKISDYDLPEGCELWLDGGHNDGAGHVLGQQAQLWAAKDNKPLHLVIGMKADKNPDDFLGPLLPFAKSLSVVPIPGINDCVSKADFEGLCTLEPTESNDAHAAIQAILENNERPCRILVCGSLYLAEQIYAKPQK